VTVVDDAGAPNGTILTSSPRANDAKSNSMAQAEAARRIGAL
jgi:hypothetical protein